MRRNTLGLAAAALAAAGVVGITGAALAAADSTTPTPSSTSSTTAPPTGTPQGPPPGASQDTAVTGSAADKVIAAVEAKDSAVTITAVRKDPDGSYDAIGTKAGAPVFFDVSADLETVTAATGGPGGPGHRGAPDGSGATGGAGTLPGGAGTLPGGSGSGSTTSTNPSDANAAYVI